MVGVSCAKSLQTLRATHVGCSNRRRVTEKVHYLLFLFKKRWAQKHCHMTRWSSQRCLGCLVSHVGPKCCSRCLHFMRISAVKLQMWVVCSMFHFPLCLSVLVLFNSWAMKLTFSLSVFAYLPQNKFYARKCYVFDCINPKLYLNSFVALRYLLIGTVLTNTFFFLSFFGRAAIKYTHAHHIYCTHSQNLFSN